MELSMKKTSKEGVTNEGKEKKISDPKVWRIICGDIRVRAEPPQGRSTHTKDASKPLLHVALSQPEI